MEEILKTEMAVIDAVFRGAKVPILSEDAFSDGRHRTIWQVIRELDNQGVPADLVAVGVKLMEDGLTQQAGGTAYYSDLYGSTPVQTENVELHADVLRREFQMRKIGLICEETIERIGTHTEVKTLVEDFTDEVMALAAVQRTKAVSLSDSLDETLVEMQLNASNPGRQYGISSGLRPLDEITRGFRPGQLVVIGARTGVGKTSFALDIARNSAKEGERVLFFSLEQSVRELKYKLLGAETQIPTADLEESRYTSEQWEKVVLPAKERLGATAFEIDDRSGISDRDVIEQVRVIKPTICLVDYVGLMSASRKRSERYLEVGSISSSLKALAKEFQIPVILLAQLNREFSKRKNKRPVLTDLRESDSLGQDADIVILLYRKTGSDGQMVSETEMIVDKNRNGEPAGCYATFLGECTTFTERYR